MPFIEYEAKSSDEPHCKSVFVVFERVTIVLEMI